MADHSEETPFLADTDHGDDYERERHYTKKAPANSFFKLPIKIITGITSFLSFAIFGVLIATIVLLKVGPFSYTYGSNDSARDLAICLVVNFLLSMPTIFVQIPIIINIAVNIAMSIVILVFSAQIFTQGWPDSSFCYRWNRDPNGRYESLPETYECRNAKAIIEILMGVSGGVGIFIGLLILAVLLLRVIAVARTRFWEGKKVGNIGSGFKGWNPTGFTIQFSLSVIPQERSQAARATDQSKAVASSGSEEGRLIET